MLVVLNCQACKVINGSPTYAEQLCCVSALMCSMCRGLPTILAMPGAMQKSKLSHEPVREITVLLEQMPQSVSKCVK